ncbi:MAG: family N-acetyltransferase, partial [Candidatus Thermoplasmatota archaeon]|nr:family N-acetyltransferase [Candidatus Thermoplasmatota archaeon]
GAKMIERVLADLDSRGVKSVELDAEPKAIEFYSPYSFKRMEEVSYFVRPPSDPAVEVEDAASGAFSWLSPSDTPAMAKTVSSAIGYDEGDLRRVLARNPPDHALSSVAEGRLNNLLISRIGRDIHAIGPWIMESPVRDDAERMLRALLSRVPGKRADVLSPSSNEVARAALDACGFEMARTGIVRLVRSSGHMPLLPKSVLCIGHVSLI